MGADLYRRKNAPTNEEHLWERSQEAVDDGYFRDPYNDGSVLWQYGLSWWRDITKLQDEEGVISVENTKKFLQMLAERETVFEENIASQREEEQKDLRKGVQLLKKFLQDAIALDSPIDASL
jgi:hypothetical protein